MNTNTTPASAVAEQTENNTTGWIGHLPGNSEVIARGQTFISNAEGDLQSIEVYSNMVTDPGKVIMTVHTYDPANKSWGPVLATSTAEFNKSDMGKWVRFNINGPHLDKGKAYGFRVESNESLIGIGEAAGSAAQPLRTTGEEWKFEGNTRNGNAFSFFSLAYRVGVKAA